MRQAGQASQARERLLEALVNQIDMPLPERIVEAEADQRRHSLQDQLDRAGLTMQAYLESSNTTQAKLDADFAEDARRSVRARFILDKLASQEEIKVSAEQLSAYVTEQAYRMGVAPDQLAKQLSDNGQLPAVAADVLRGNALSWLAARATVADEAGRPVDVSAVGEAEDQEDEAGTGDDASGAAPADDSADVAGDEG
jgi:trigger factor